MAKVLRLLVIVIVLAGVAGGIYAWVGSRGADEDGNTLIAAEIGSITEKALAVGQIEPREKFQVKSKISGIVKRCFVEVGDTVRAGDPLFEIAPDPTPQELLNVDHGVQASEASFLKAKADYERGVELLNDGLMSKGDLDALRESYELARIARQQASDNRELTRSGKVTGGTGVETLIRTSASGTVLSRAVNVGDPVVPSDLLPTRDRACHRRRHGRPDLQGDRGRDRRRQDLGRDAVPDQGRRPARRRRHRAAGAHRATGPEERGRDPLRRRDRARSRARTSSCAPATRPTPMW